MRLNPVKNTIQNDGVSSGTFMFEFSSAGIGPIAAAAGAEFAVFDMEHTGWTHETIRKLVGTTRATPMVPMVRVPATEYDFISRALDMAAMGVMVPMVESKEQAMLIAASTKYPPVGRRGAVLTACKKHGKTPGFMATDIPRGKQLNRGFRILAYSGDLWIYQSALVDGINGLKQHAASR